MKYAKEIISLMAAYPGKSFKMRHLVNFIRPNAKGTEYDAIRKGILRVLEHLKENNLIRVENAESKTTSRYAWKLRHEVVDN